MRVVNVSYNYNTDKTTVSLAKEFKELPLIHQLDALQDAHYLLMDIYNDKLSDLHAGRL